MDRFFRVSLLGTVPIKSVDIHAETPKKAKNFSITLFAVKYPHLKELDTDDLLVKEITEDELRKV